MCCTTAVDEYTAADTFGSLTNTSSLYLRNETRRGTAAAVAAAATSIASQGKERKKYATGVLLSDGRVRGSGVSDTNLDDPQLPGLATALALSRRNEQNAVDEVRASHIAALALGMAFTVLPVAFSLFLPRVKQSKIEKEELKFARVERSDCASFIPMVFSSKTLHYRWYLRVQFCTSFSNLT